MQNVGDYTSNCSGMWALALGGTLLSELEEVSCAEALPKLEAALVHMRDPKNRAAYEAMQPDNGWGSHDGATTYLQKIRDACAEHVSHGKLHFWV